MPEPATCTSCAAEIPAGARFCVKCGTPAPGATPAAPAPDAAPAPTEPVPAAPPASPGPATSEVAAVPEPPAPGPDPAPGGPAAEPSWSAGTAPASTADADTLVPPGGAPQTAPTQPGISAPEPTTTIQPPPAGGFASAGAGPGYGAGPPVAGYQTPPSQWAAAPPPAPEPKPKAPASSRTIIAAIIGFISALAFGVSSFLNWAEVDTFRNISGAVVTGWDGLTGGIQDGPFFALVAVVAGAIAASMLTGRASLLQKLLLLAAGAVAMGMSIYELSSYKVDIDDINRLGGDASIGFGLFLAVGASLGLLVAAVLAKRTKAEPAPAPGAAPVGPQGPAATITDPRAVGAVG